MDPPDAVFMADRRSPASNLLLDQLPSYQSLLYRRKSSSSRRRSSVWGKQSSTISKKWVWHKSGVGGDETRPVREIPASMEEKRREKHERLQQGGEASGWSLWRLSVRHSVRRLRDDGWHLLSSLEPWRSDIHLIEGMFGTGILSYFHFLRFLVMLNFITFLLMFVFVMLPVIITSHTTHNITYSRSNDSVCSVYPDTSRQGLVLFHQHIIDLLSGTGFLERTYLFYGYYRLELILSEISYNLPLAYLLTTIACLMLSLLWIVKRSANGFKRKLIQDEDRFQSFCNKIFSGWDFCIRNESASRLKRSSLLYELKTDLEEERVKRRMESRSRGERVRIFTLRAALNVLVMSVLCVCFYCIYWATVFSQQKQAEEQQRNFVLELMVEYLPSIVITLANFITPLLFSVIISFEDYSPAFEIRFTLMRCVFMRLASIGVLLFSLWTQVTSCGSSDCVCGYNHQLYPCWETHVGQEMYKLMIFDFLIIAAVTIFVEFPRRMLVTYCGWPIVKWWGQQEFAVPQNVLEIVYSQTICWIGIFYCPLLPAINTLKYVLVFYLKKVSLVTNCRPATRPFRASSSNFFFLVVLLIGLSLASVPVIVSIAVIRSSGACGPFTSYVTSWQVVSLVITQLPVGLSSFLLALASEAFAVSFFVITCLGMFYVMALAGAHKRVIEQLRDQLVMEGRDKRFLIQKLFQTQGSVSVSHRKRSDSSLFLLEPVLMETQA